MADTDGPAQPAPYRLRWYGLIGVQVAGLGAGAILAWLLTRAGATAFLTSFNGLALVLDASNLVLLALSLRCLKRDAALPVRLRALSLRGWAFVAVAGLALLGLSLAYESLAGKLLHVDIDAAENAMPLVAHHARQMAVGIVTVALLGPLTEEVYFRGLLMGWLSRHWGMGSAIAGSALLFGLAHMAFLTPGSTTGLVLTVELVLMGLALGLVAARTGSLWASFAIHAVNNLCAMLLSFFF